MRQALKDFRDENDQANQEKLDLPDVNAQVLYNEIVKKQKDDVKMAGIEAVKDFCLSRPSVYDE